MWSCPPVCSNTHNLLPGRFVGSCCRYPGFHLPPPFFCPPSPTAESHPRTDQASAAADRILSMLHPLHTKERSVEPQRSSTRIPPSMAGPRVHRLHIVLGGKGCQGSPNAIAACPSLSLTISRLTLLPEAEELPVVVASNLNQASCRALFFRRHPMYLFIYLLPCGAPMYR